MPLAYSAKTAPAARLVFQLTGDDQLALWDDLGRKGSLTVAATFDLQVARIKAPDGLFCLAISTITHAGGLVLGQVVIKLALKHRFQKVFEHRAEDAVRPAPLFAF